MSEQNHYRYLETRPHHWRKQLWFKDRKLTVWHVIAVMRANHFTPEEVAEGYRLPVEAVLEAMDYYEKNKDIVDADTAEERQALLETGLLKD
jgi:uncharacterized protein (DUF433 family)